MIVAASGDGILISDGTKYKVTTKEVVKRLKFILTLSGPDLICDDKIKIECAVLYNMRRYISRQIYEMKNIDSRLKEIRKELKLFLDKYSSKKSEGD